MKKTLPLPLIAILLVIACGKKNDPLAMHVGHTTLIVTVATVAGSGAQGAADGIGTAASFFEPLGVATDAAGNVYVADLGNNKIRKINSNGVVTTLAGSGASGYANGTGNTSTFFEPSGVAVDGAGNIFVADFGNNMIRKISPGGVVTTFAGNRVQGSANGAGTASSFNVPTNVTTDHEGNMYVADFGNNLVRKITSNGIVTTFAGGAGTVGSFNGPSGVAVDTAGNVYVADNGNNRIAMINLNGAIIQLAFVNYPSSVAISPAGNIYVAVPQYNQIWQINPNGTAVVLAGNGSPGSVDTNAGEASFNSPSGIAVDAAGNIYVADTGNNLIRKIIVN